MEQRKISNLAVLINTNTCYPNNSLIQNTLERVVAVQFLHGISIDKPSTPRAFRFMDNGEIWAQVPSLPPGYFISNAGRLKSYVKNKKGKVLKPKIGNSGYEVFCISINGKNKTHLTHRLVAEAFIQNLDNKPEVNHIDLNKVNNIVSNLEWVTRSQNAKHVIDRTGYYSGRKVLPVLKYSIEGDFIGEYPNASEAAKSIGKTANDIVGCLNGRAKTAYGVKWYYKYGLMRQPKTINFSKAA